MRALMVVFCALFLSASVPARAAQSVQFADLLKEAGLQFQKSDDLKEAALPGTPLYEFEKALKHVRLPLKVFYAIRPLARMEIEYNDPHSNAPDPNQVFPLIFQALVSKLARHGSSPSRTYPAKKAKALFNADWAAASIFDADPELNSGYKSALLIAIHKHKRADAYVLFAFDDAREVKEAIDKALPALRFAKSDPSQ